MMLMQFAGHLGADPETRMSPNGQKIISFRMAINSKRQGKEETTWVRVTIFGDRFDRMMPYIKKGSALFIVGTLNPPRTYVANDGSTQVSLDVIAEHISFNPFGRSERSNQEEGVSNQAQAYATTSRSQAPAQQFSTVMQGAGTQMDISDDEIPF